MRTSILPFRVCAASAITAMRRHNLDSRTLFLASLAFLATSHSVRAAEIITGTDTASSHVKVFDGQTLAEQASFFAYPGFTGGVRVASGDINNDGIADVITGAGASGNGHVKVFDGNTGDGVRSFFAYPGYTGDVYVGAGDLNQDGFADLITGTGEVASHVKVFDGQSGSEIRSFFAYAGFQGGVRVAGGDINKDGFDDIITGAGTGGNGHVKVFDGQSGAEIRSFFAYGGYTGGIYVGAGDVNNDGYDDIITGLGEAGSHVKVFDGQSGSEIRSFIAYLNFQGGVRVAGGDINNDGFYDIITGAGAGGIGHVKVFDGLTGSESLSFLAYSGYADGVYVAGISAIPEASSLFLVALTLSIVGVKVIRRQSLRVFGRVPRRGEGPGAKAPARCRRSVLALCGGGRGARTR